ncbi:MAG: Gfo/Idh/MocA family oxidoreductase [Thermoguttaceae bacterium]
MAQPSHLSRRKFFQHGAALAAAGVAAPHFIPSGVLAAPGRPGANDKIGIAGIGIGRQGSGDLAAALKDPRTRFIAVAEVNLPRGEATAKIHRGVAVKDYRKLLDRKDIDAVITATPEHWRALICIHACQALKDIYAEKPMTLTIREGRLMTQAVRKYDRVFQVGSQQRSMPIDQKACEFIRSGGLGKISTVQYWNYPSPWQCGLEGQPLPEGLDWNLWCGPTKVVPYHPELYIPRGKPGWLSFRPYSGGEFTGWGAHGLDMVQYALGMDESGPVEIWTEGPKFTPLTYTEPESSKRGNAITNKPNVFFRYANGVLLEPVEKAPSFGAYFYGEKGKMTIDRGKVTSEPKELAVELLKTVPNSDNHIRNWLDCIGSREKPNGDVEIGHRSATVCHLGNIARWAGRKLQWDPVKETFVGDDEANQYLDRTRRKGYELPEKI